MNELIKVTEKDGKQIVSARELYLGLGLEKSHWSRWSTQNIEEDKFFKENEDWVGFAIVVNGNETQDYAITNEVMLTVRQRAKGIIIPLFYNISSKLMAIPLAEQRE